MKKTIFGAVLAAVVGSGIIFFACSKDKEEGMIATTTTKSAVMHTNQTQVDTNLVKAALIIADVQEHFMDAYTRDEATFVALCEEQNYESLIQFLGYDEKTWQNMNDDLRSTVEKFLATYPEFAGTTTESSSCSTCALQYLPEITKDLIENIDKRATWDPDALAYCLAQCAINCANMLAFGPWWYAGCVAACTALCYGGSVAMVGGETSYF
jgi:hypothetical protein